MNNKIAFLTTIFPMKKVYLSDLFNSLQKQTYKDFDIIVINDGYQDFEGLKAEYSNLNIIELKFSNTPAKNREFGIDYIVENNYHMLIFGDSDDYFDINRIELSIELLRDFDIVVNDLTLFNDKEGAYFDNYLTNRIEDRTEVTLDFIKNKNVFGLSNTAVNVSVLNNIYFDKDLIAVDWYLYSILLLRDTKAIFTNKTITYYRQYENNTIGFGSMTMEALLKGMAVKKKHYSLLLKEDKTYVPLYETILSLEKRYEIQHNLDKLLQQNIENPLWWEEITIQGKLNEN